MFGRVIVILNGFILASACLFAADICPHDKFLKENFKITDDKELDTLLCHCQNKLNGNIDGIEIDLGTDE